MRTIPFRSVFDGVVRLHGRDPLTAISPDMSRAIVERINQRVRVICNVWRWPSWELTEERAFRQVWNSTHQYKRVSDADGRPDEVFYLGAGYVVGGEFGTGFGYYKVKTTAVSDPPVGTLPTDDDFFELIDPVDTFIAYDQGCRRSIGMVLGVYGANPRVPTGSNGSGVSYQPSERGIDVLRPSGPTVFIHYKMPVPRYTIVPYVVGKTYAKGNVVFDPATDECFQALSATSMAPSNTAFWRRVPFPEEWAQYVIQGAFADSLLEFDQGGNGADMQIKMALAGAANEKADMLLQTEVDSLTAQGQKLQWNFCKRSTTCCETTQPWSGGTVSTLTDTCEDELGWIYPSPPDAGGVNVEYHPEIIAIKTVDGTPSLQQLASAHRLTGSRVELTIIVGGIPEAQTWQLFTGAADPLDLGQQAPDDFNVGTNNRHWARV